MVFLLLSDRPALLSGPANRLEYGNLTLCGWLESGVFADEIP